ncbi:MAG TPA: FtsX-like permease family protein, partial [Gemmatimonadales bacterium]
RLSMTLLTLFAALAMLLALIGIYGITAYTVTQRTRELGLRIAIGARPAEVVGMLLRENLLLVIGGLVLGMAGAALATRALRTMLFGVSTLDAVTFIGAALVLGGVAMLATYVPARRAARIDPMVALRYE